MGLYGYDAPLVGPLGRRSYAIEVNRNKNFSCIQMFFTAFVLCILTGNIELDWKY